MSNAAHDHDSLPSILAALVPMPIVGISITMQPGFVQAWVDYLHYDEVSAGFVASSEVGGLMAATILFALLGDRMPMRRSVAAGLVLIIVANLASLPCGAGLLFALTRVLAGFGAGLATSVCFTAMGRTSNSGRNYGWAIAAVIGYSAIGLGVLPAIFALGGAKSLLIAYSLTVLPCFAFLRWLPPERGEPGLGGIGAAAPAAARLRTHDWLSLASILLFFVAYSCAWTYMALLGRDAGLSEGAISRTLSLSQFAGVAGALGVAILSGRLSFLTLAIGILGSGAIGIVAFAVPQGAFVFLLLNCLFQFCWNAGQPLLLAIVSENESTERVLRMAIPLQFIGTAMGPSFAAMLLGGSGAFVMVIAGAAIVAAISLLLVIPVVRRPSGKHMTEIPGAALG